MSPPAADFASARFTLADFALADFSLADPTHLGEHFRQCAFARGPLHRLRCVAEALHAFLAPRFVTTLAVMTLVVWVGLSIPA